MLLQTDIQFQVKGVFEETSMNRFCRPDRHRTPQFTRATRLESKPDLERDSGFSDTSSEYLSTVDLTDSEDAVKNGSIVSHDSTGPQVAVMGGSYTGLSPMIIMNNFVLKQPSQMVPAEKQWGFPSSLEVMPQSQVVILQPMLSNGSSSSSSSSSSRSSTKTEKTRKSKGYKPILKSYPRIAPYPANAPTKRLRVSSTSGYDQRKRRRHHSHRLQSSPSPQPALQAPFKAISTFEAAKSQSQAAERQEQLSDKSLSPLTGSSSLPPVTTDEFRTEIDFNGMNDDQDAFCTDGDKQKRFSNTYNILNKSGLLGITMRTKQLIKENKRTQGQLQQLQEQTTLLLQALSCGDPQVWTKLQLSLQHKDKKQMGAKAQSVLE